MKTKKIKKKLALNKVTVDHLTNHESKGINGGAGSLEACSEYTYCEENCDPTELTKDGPACLLIPDLHN